MGGRIGPVTGARGPDYEQAAVEVLARAQERVGVRGDSSMRDAGRVVRGVLARRRAGFAIVGGVAGAGRARLAVESAEAALQRR